MKPGGILRYRHIYVLEENELTGYLQRLGVIQ